MNTIYLDSWKSSHKSESEPSRISTAGPKLASFDQKIAFSVAFGVLLTVRLGLWILPLRFLRGISARAAHRVAAGEHSNPPTVELITGVVEMAARCLPGTSSLALAITTQYLLAWIGQTSTLRVGVLTEPGGKLHLHAWVQCMGKIVMGDLPDMHRFAAASAAESSPASAAPASTPSAPVSPSAAPSTPSASAA